MSGRKSGKEPGDGDSAIDAVLMALGSCKRHKSCSHARLE